MTSFNVYELTRAGPTLLLGAFFLAALYSLRRWILLPAPLTGIPYNQESAKRLFGDVSDLRSDPDGLAKWCSKQLVKLDTPICQALLGPDFLQKPIVLVADVGDVRDQLLSRSDFDRSSYITDRFPLFGNFHLNFKTNENWKLARQWMKDLLTPQYLGAVASPAIDLGTRRLIKLWEHRSQLAHGRAFDMTKDVKSLNIDVIMAFYFGDDMADSILDREVQYTKGLREQDLKEGMHGQVTYPRAQLHHFSEGLIYVSDTITALYATAWPPLLAAWWTRYLSSQFRRYFVAKDRFLRVALNRAIQRTQNDPDESKKQSGLDHMVWREGRAATKAARKPLYQRQVMIDETYGNLVAGQHTTSAAIVWILKYLTDHLHVQELLRKELHGVFVSASEEHRLPNASEISESLKMLPYLRAVIEEMLRLRQAMLVPRDAVCDTQLLGCHIPKGTVLLLVTQGFDPSSLGKESGRQVTTRRTYPGHGVKDLENFDPERWLVRKDNGEVEFDGTAYPQLAFGGGVRACWGRKLADLEMQIITAMLVWRFDFLEVPEPLRSHKATYDISYRANLGYVNVRLRTL